MDIILLFFGPPIVAAGILVGIFHLPFRIFEDESRGLKLYFWFRVAVVILGFAGLLWFRFLGGYDDLSSSPFSPIGTDGKGLVILWVTAGVFVFGIISFFELLRVLGNRMLHDPDRNRSEHDEDAKPDHAPS